MLAWFADKHVVARRHDDVLIVERNGPPGDDISGPEQKLMGPRMIYDCFLFYNEVEILKVRMHELSDIVDRFVIVESTRTFQGQSKPLWFQANRHAFQAFESKIIHKVCDIPEPETGVLPGRAPSAAWAREHYQRNFIATALGDLRDDDLVMISDVDEIVSAEALRRALHERRKHDLTIFEMPNFTGFFNRKMTAVSWLHGPRMIEFSHFTTPQKMRMTRAFASRRLKGGLLGRVHTRIWNYFHTGVGAPVRIYYNAGWHFTSIGDWNAWRNKVNSFSHEELKGTDSYLREDAFMENVLQSTRSVPISELPEYIRKNKEQFLFLE